MITALRTFCSLMFTQHHHRKQFTFCTLEPSMLKVYLMPHLIQTICAIIKKHSFQQQQQQQHQAQAVIHLHIQMIFSIKWKRSPTTTLCIT